MKNYNLLRNMIITVLLVLGMGALIAFAQELSPEKPLEEDAAKDTVKAAVSTAEPAASGQAQFAASFVISPPEPFLKAS